MGLGKELATSLLCAGATAGVAILLSAATGPAEFPAVAVASAPIEGELASVQKFVFPAGPEEDTLMQIRHCREDECSGKKVTDAESF